MPLAFFEWHVRFGRSGAGGETVQFSGSGEGVKGGVSVNLRTESKPSLSRFLGRSNHSLRWYRGFAGVQQ
jgi:hypothetical protein